jgi:hypothetical protein
VTRSQAIDTLVRAFTKKFPNMGQSARLLAEEAVCALGGDLKLDPELASMDAKVTRAPYRSMM